MKQNRRKAAKPDQAAAIYCNPDVCPMCQYIGDGDSLCEVTQEIVLCDWMPTNKFMGPGCPYTKKGGPIHAS